MIKIKRRALVSSGCDGKSFNCRTVHGKGQAALISHAIIVGFSVFLVYAVMTTFTSIRDDYQTFVGGEEVKQLCFVLRGAVDKVYNPVDYVTSVDTTMSAFEARLPDRITDIKFSASFANKSIVVKGTNFNETCKVGYDAGYNGSTSGGLTRFSYVRNANGTDTIEMVKL